MEIKTLNPATEQVLDTYDIMDKEEVDNIFDKTKQAYSSWSKLSIKERIPYFRKLADVIRDNKEKYATVMTKEMGKPIKEARAEIEKCAWTAEVYAENAEEWLADEHMDADGKKHIVTYAPLGVILSIMPWNFPFWQAMRFAIPTLMAGNTSILKHSSEVPESSLAIEEAFRLAGFPENVFRTIITDHENTESLIPQVQGVSLTGSVGAGKRIAEIAGRYLKKVVLELGGSDPFIVLEDADIDHAARIAAKARNINSGQSCIAAKRFIVLKQVADEFIEKFTEEVSKLKVGDPMNDETDIGPLVSQKACDQMVSFMDDVRKKGGDVLAGGIRQGERGFFFEPAVVLADKDMRAVNEEVFGPIAPILVVDTVDEAIEIANDNQFGLGGSVWTADIQRGEEIARKIEAGTIFVNSMVKSDPRMPFGGIKDSGIGRELSKWGIREFVNVKSINIYEAK